MAASYSKGASTPPGPWTIGLLAAMPLVIGGLVTAITAFAGDASIPGGSAQSRSRPMISKGENVIMGTHNDDVLMAPGISGLASGGGMAGGTGIGKLVTEIRRMRQNTEAQMKQHQDTWGTGQAPRKMGRFMGDQVRSLGGMS